MTASESELPWVYKTAATRISYSDFVYRPRHYRLMPRDLLPLCQVRREPEIQELRIWQKEWRQETENISKKVDSFWRRNMPDEPHEGILADVDNASLDESIDVNDTDTHEPDAVPEFSQAEEV